MAAKTILDRLGITQEKLEQLYAEVGNYRTLADQLGVSKTTLQKYLTHIAHDTRPWASVKSGDRELSQDYLRRKYRKEVMEHFEREMLRREVWIDVNGRRIPKAAILTMTATPPRLLTPIIPVYGKLRGTGEVAVFIFKPKIEWLNPGQAEQT